LNNSQYKKALLNGLASVIEKGFFHQTVMHYDLDKLYFIMTANAFILKQVGAIKHYYVNNKLRTTMLDNINHEQLADYATLAANYATHGQYFPLQMASNKHGKPDVSLFYCSPNVTANHAGRILESDGRQLMVFLVGDSLIHPFWKTGSGLAKGFMSVFDAAWVLKIFCTIGPQQPLLCLALQESLYLFLKNLQSSAIRSHDSSFSIDPATRYKSLTALPCVRPTEVRNLMRVTGDNQHQIRTPNGRRQSKSLLTDRPKQQGSSLPRLDLKRQNTVATTSDFPVFSLLKRIKNIV